MDLKINKIYITFSVMAFLLFFWQFSYSIFNFSENIIPTPTKLFIVFIQLIANGELLMHSLSSLQRVLIGFSVATIIGISLGLLCASIKNLRYVINPIVEILRPIPPIAWIPLAIILLGLGLQTHLVTNAIKGNDFPGDTEQDAIALMQKTGTKLIRYI